MIADLEGRAAAAEKNPGFVPSERGRSQEFGAQLRSATVEKDGKQFVHLQGYASTVDEPYEMYDMFGPYTEVVDRAAFDKTLSASPDVAFLLNHTGMTMARTKSGSLSLSTDEHGLAIDAFLNPERSDVSDLKRAIDDGDVDQMSFAFRINRGQWSPDYTEYRILEVDLDRGDVSAVNYGANPFTSISARAKQAFAAVDEMPAMMLRELAERAQARLGDAPPAVTREPVVEAATEPLKARAMSYAEAALRQAIA